MCIRDSHYVDGNQVDAGGVPQTVTWPNYNVPLRIGYQQDVEYYNGYADEIRISKGIARYPAGANFTVPTSAYTADEYDVLLLHCDGSNGGTTFTDSSFWAHTPTVSGAVHTDTAIKKFGTASAQFDGTGDYLTVAHDAGFNFGSEEFCVEAYIYHTGTPSQYEGIVCHRNGGTGWELKINTGLKVSWYDSDSGAETLSNAAISNDTWYHVAIVRVSTSNLKIYINGTDRTAEAEAGGAEAARLDPLGATSSTQPGADQ